MVSQQASGQWVIVASLIVALLFSVWPMPLWAQWGRPEWVAMVLIYWVLALPGRVGIGVCWLAGLAQDILQGAPLGQNALAFSVIAYICLILYQRVRMFSPWQQAAIVFILVGLNQLIGHWVQTINGTQSANLLFLLPALVSALLWPWLSVLLRFFRRAFYVH